MKVDVNVEISGEFDSEKLKDIVSIELEKCAYKIERTAKELVPHEYPGYTRDLAGSIETNGQDWTFTVSTNVEYSEWIEDGTSPHDISGNPLHWDWDGEDHYAYQVHHPGNKAYKYMETAMNTHVDDLGEAIAEAIRREL